MKKFLNIALFFYLISISILSYSEISEKLNIQTSHGNMVIEIYPEKAPTTVKNFLSYVDKGFYNGTIFHRVIEGFMAQGGDPFGNGTGGPGYNFEDEIRIYEEQKHNLD